jgi:hypothetical protein
MIHGQHSIRIPHTACNPEEAAPMLMQANDSWLGFTRHIARSQSHYYPTLPARPRYATLLMSSKGNQTMGRDSKEKSP